MKLFELGYKCTKSIFHSRSPSEKESEILLLIPIRIWVITYRDIMQY